MFRIFAVTLAGGLIAATGLALPALAEASIRTAI